MAFTDEDTGGGAAESVGGAGDEDTGHGRILPPKCARTDRRGPAMGPGNELRGAGPGDPPGGRDEKAGPGKRGRRTATGRIACRNCLGAAGPAHVPDPRP